MKMNFLYTVPEYKKIRVIIDTDAACEADDPFAIVQGLLSPKLIVKGIVAEHFVEEGSMERSLAEIHTILDAMDMKVPALAGNKGPLVENADKDTVEVSEGSQFIIDEAMKDDDKPLFILCQGAITNVAAAFIKCPEIIKKVTVIWIGTHGEGNVPAPFREFNAGNDIQAANLILKSGTDLWLVPSDVYTTINIGIAEIQRRILPCGEIGKHLFENLDTYNQSEYAGWTKGESWSLGDSPAIALALNPDCGKYVLTPAPDVMEDTSSRVNPYNPIVKIYKDVDSRYILEDLIAKLEIFSSVD
jgi:inosine-uridine nucleoside N-ribohydrolase